LIDTPKCGEDPFCFDSPRVKPYQRFKMLIQIIYWG